MRRDRAGVAEEGLRGGSRRSRGHGTRPVLNPRRVRRQPGLRTRQGKPSKPGEPADRPEHSDMRARSSFALPRLLACYIAPDGGRSAKPARCLLTELFHPPDLGFTYTFIPTDFSIIVTNPASSSISAITPRLEGWVGRTSRGASGHPPRAGAAGGRPGTRDTTTAKQTGR